jgi:hypothetical protein
LFPFVKQSGESEQQARQSARAWYTVPNAKYKKQNAQASLISSQQYANLLGIIKDWSTMTEAFKAIKHRKIRLHGACSLFFLSLWVVYASNV